MNRDEIDQALAAPGQQVARSAVRALPEETLSMSWRSSLNERLAAESALRRRRARFVWALRPALGLGLACTLAVLIWFKTPHASAPSLTARSGGELEAALVTTHRQSTYAWEVAGVGLSPVDFASDTEANSSRASHAATSTAPGATSASAEGWNEEDLDTL